LVDPVDNEEFEDIPILPEGVPVAMPDLPLSVTINTAEQFKAISDPLRLKILGIIRHQPATAKQIATRLQASPGTIGHHLHVLEKAGLAQVVARRVTRGIIAKYYTRTGRIIKYDMPPEIVGKAFHVDFLNSARDELAEAILDYNEDIEVYCGFPHARISPERAEFYGERLRELINDFLQEPVDPEGQVYALSVALFKAPAWQSVIKENEA
jgi:DNA-binding transcriptional ArsR family regulator